MISGVAGKDAEGYEVRTRLLVDGKYVPVTINGVEATGLLDATKSVLTKHAKPEFLPFVRIEPPTSAENHVKFKAAIRPDDSGTEQPEHQVRDEFGNGRARAVLRGLPPLR